MAVSYEQWMSDLFLCIQIPGLNDSRSKLSRVE